MVEGVEHFPTQFQLQPLAHGDGFLECKINVLITGALKAIEAHVAEGPQLWIGECAGIEECSGYAWLVGRLLPGNEIRSLLAIRIGKIPISVRNREPVA